MAHPRVEQLELDNQLCFALYAASRAMVRAYGPALEPLELTYPQYVTLLALWEADRSVTVGELGQTLHLDSGTLTPLLKRLEAADLVRRRRDPADERRVMVEVTDAGWRVRERAAGVPGQVFGGLGLSLDDGARLKARLVELTELLERAEGRSTDHPPPA